MEWLTGCVRQAWSIAQPGRRLSILLYHQVLDAADPLRPDDPDKSAFDWQMSLLKRHTNVLPLAEGFKQMAAGSLPPRATAITFDDGYANNRTQALPILQKHGLAATFFVAAGYLNGGRMFNDTLIEAIRRAPNGVLDLRHEGLGVFALSHAESRKHAIRAVIREIKWLPRIEREAKVQAIARTIGVGLPDDLMMTDQQVCELADAGMSIGGHTLSHPILAQEDEHTAAREIIEGRDRLKAITGAPIDVFAYPNGKPGQDYTQRDVKLVRQAGFRHAVSTSMGAGTAEADPLQIPRFTPWSRNSAKFLAQLVRNTRHPVTVA